MIRAGGKRNMEPRQGSDKGSTLIFSTANIQGKTTKHLTRTVMQGSNCKAANTLSFHVLLAHFYQYIKACSLYQGIICLFSGRQGLMFKICIYCLQWQLFKSAYPISVQPVWETFKVCSSSTSCGVGAGSEDCTTGVDLCLVF